MEKGNVGRRVICQHLIAIGNPGLQISEGKKEQTSGVSVGLFNESRGLEAGFLCSLKSNGV